MKSTVYRFALRFLVLLSLGYVAGCSRAAPELESGAVTVPLSLLSPSVRNAAQLQTNLLAEAIPTPPGRIDVQTYFHLRQDLLIPERRASAAESLWTRWDRDPENLILITAAWQRRRDLGDVARVEARLDALTAADSTGAVAHFIHATRHWGRGEEDRQRMFLAEGVLDTAAGVGRSWLELRLAMTEAHAGDYEAGRDRLTKALPEAWRLGGAPLAASWWRDISKYSRYVARWDDALAASQLAVACAQAGSDPLLEARGLLELGAVRGARGEQGAAVDAYGNCEERSREHGYLRLMKPALDAQYELLSSRGDRRSAQDVARRSRELALVMQDTAAAITNALHIGIDHRYLGQLDSVDVWFQRAERLDSAGTPQGRRGEITFARIRFANQLGEFSIVDSLWALSAEFSKPMQRATVLNEIIAGDIERGRSGRVYEALKKAETLESGLEAISAYDPILDRVILSARFHARQGEFGIAHGELARAEARVALGRPPIEQWDLANAVAEVAELGGDLATAAEFHGDALVMAIDMARPEQVNRSRVRLGRVFTSLGRFEEARELFAESRNAPEYWTRLASAIALGEIEAAAGQNERALERLAGADSLLREKAPKDLISRVRLEQSRVLAELGRPVEAYASLQQIAHADPDQASPDLSAVVLAFQRPIQTEAAEIGIGLLHDHPGLVGGGDAAVEALSLAEGARWRLETAGPTPEKLEALSLPSGVVVAAFFVGEARAFAWVGMSSGWSLREIEDRGALVRRVQALAVDTKSPDRSVDLASARALGDQLLGPVLSEWTSKEPLYIVAPGILTALPWGALPISDEQVLLERGPVVSLAEMRVLRPSSEDRDPRVGRLLSLGVNDPVGSARLRHAETEARAVGEIWTGDSPTVFTGEAAHWNSVRATNLARFNVIHLATHARFSQGPSGRATLRLAGGEQDTPVTIPEIRALGLNADLVFLSCCSGAQSQGRTGTGLDSFARAFLAAGAQSVVAATDPVEDAAARWFAERFYQHWLGGKSKAASLKAAQLDVRDDRPEWSHPFYWAHYQLHAAGVAVD